MKISVIITTYNKPDYLKKVMEGYLQQTIPPDEIVIADDGSTEDTAILVNKLKADAGITVKHVWHEDKGFRAAGIRNMAIAKSIGEYILLCDDDAVPCAEMVRDHLNHAEKGCFIQGHRVLLGAELSKTLNCRNITLLTLAVKAVTGGVDNIINAVRFPIPLIKKSYNPKGIRSCNMSFFRQDLLDVNGFNEDFVGWGKEDSELAARFYQHGIKRKDLRFRAVCYHLYHQFYDRDKLENNLALLDTTIKKGDIRCVNGIDKY